MSVFAVAIIYRAKLKKIRIYSKPNIFSIIKYFSSKKPIDFDSKVILYRKFENSA
jgi:hypothetical protein